MKAKTAWIALTVLAGVASLSIPVYSHHSFAMFDMTKSVTVVGTVKEWKWVNPHCWLYIDAAGPSKAKREWSFETSNSAVLIRQGWNKNILRPGDKVTVTGHPSRDGASVGTIETVTIPDGRVLRGR